MIEPYGVEEEEDSFKNCILLEKVAFDKIKMKSFLGKTPTLSVGHQSIRPGL